MDPITTPAPAATTPTATTPPVDTQTTTSTSPVTPTPPSTPTAPIELQFDETVPEPIKNFAKTQNFSQEQFNSTFKFFNDVITQSNERAMQESYQRGKAHVESWGEEAPHKISLAKQALQVTDRSGEVTKYLRESGAANNPVVMNFLVDLGKMLQEGGFIHANANPIPGKKTLADKLFNAQS